MNLIYATLINDCQDSATFKDEEFTTSKRQLISAVCKLFFLKYSSLPFLSGGLRSDIFKCLKYFTTVLTSLYFLLIFKFRSTLEFLSYSLQDMVSSLFPHFYHFPLNNHQFIYIPPESSILNWTEHNAPDSLTSKEQ